MFTSRAEYRLSLREDNADQRLTPVGRRLGVVGDARWRVFERKQQAVASERERLAAARIAPADVPESSPIGVLARDVAAAELLRRPSVGYAEILALPAVGPGHATLDLENEQLEQVARALEVEARYAGYIARQGSEIERQRRHAETPLPSDLDYRSVRGLSNEVREKLERIRPADIGQAARISGMTPAAVSLLLIHLKKQRPRRTV
jgi:tRNA uridine 5-carboxymethylaminomethyl modification enzyme